MSNKSFALKIYYFFLNFYQIQCPLLILQINFKLTPRNTIYFTRPFIIPFSISIYILNSPFYHIMRSAKEDSASTASFIIITVTIIVLIKIFVRIVYTIIYLSFYVLGPRPIML